MRHHARALFTFVLAGGLVVLPLSGVVHAAPASGVPAAKVREGGSQIRLTVESVARVLGIAPATLQQDLQAGQTILQIAGSKYSSAQDLATALLAGAKTKLDQAVAAGNLTSSQEDQAYQVALTATETLVTTPHPDLASGGRPGSPDELGMLFKLDLLSTLATDCSTTNAALTAAFQAGGKSVLAICQATNPSATAAGLASDLTAAAKTRLDAAVGAGQVTAAQESQILSDIQANLTTWLTTPLGAGGIGPKTGTRMHAEVGFTLDAVAAVLGVTPTVLQQDLQAGQTLLQIAGSKYSSAQDLATALLVNLKTKLDHVVAAGTLTADQENQIYQAALTKAEALVTTPHPDLASDPGKQ
jgi:hypothetical protein